MNLVGGIFRAPVKNERQSSRKTVYSLLPSRYHLNDLRMPDLYNIINTTDTFNMKGTEVPTLGAAVHVIVLVVLTRIDH